jgi:hypothetical protein
MSRRGVLTEELTDPEARFVFVRRRADTHSADDAARVESSGQVASVDDDEAGALCGYVHFRFVDEEGAAVLYVYELQITPDARRCYPWVGLISRWVTRWSSLGAAKISEMRARWVTLRARWVMLRARWVTLRARWVR